MVSLYDISTRVAMLTCDKIIRIPGIPQYGGNQAGNPAGGARWWWWLDVGGVDSAGGWWCVAVVVVGDLQPVAVVVLVVVRSCLLEIHEIGQKYLQRNPTTEQRSV